MIEDHPFLGVAGRRKRGFQRTRGAKAQRQGRGTAGDAKDRIAFVRIRFGALVIVPDRIHPRRQKDAGFQLTDGNDGEIGQRVGRESRDVRLGHLGRLWLGRNGCDTGDDRSGRFRCRAEDTAQACADLLRVLHHMACRGGKEEGGASHQNSAFHWKTRPPENFTFCSGLANDRGMIGAET